MKEKGSQPVEARPSSAARGYNSAWQRAREGFLREHPLCVMCADLGRTTAATVVDHIEPHRGDREKFWDRKNWQPLCDGCHNCHKQRLEKSGVLGGCDVNGIPLDQDHHWNHGRTKTNADGDEDRAR